MVSYIDMWKRSIGEPNIKNTLADSHCLLLAIQNQDVDLCDKIIRERGHLTCCDYTHVKKAIESGNICILDILFSNGAEITELDFYKTSYLQLAISTSNIDVCRYLITRGANINNNPTSRTTLLIDSIRMGNMDVFMLLLENGADVNQCTKISSIMPLDISLARGRMDMFVELVKHGSEISKYKNKKTIVRFLKHGYFAALTSLVESGLFIDTILKDETSLLYASIRSNDTDVCIFLINNGIYIGSDSNKVSPFHRAVVKDNIPIFVCLLRAGGDVNERNKGGLSPLDMAIKRGTGCIYSAEIKIYNSAKVIQGFFKIIIGKNIANRIRILPENLFVQEFSDIRKKRLGIDSSRFSGSV